MCDGEVAFYLDGMWTKYIRNLSDISPILRILFECGWSSSPQYITQTHTYYPDLCLATSAGGWRGYTMRLL